jgi:putative ABC transport system permease protein
MRSLRAFCVRVANAFARRRHDREFADELNSHLQLHIDDNLRAGMTPAEARRAAMIALGGVIQTTERYRDRRGLPILDALHQDLMYAVRVLRKNRGFTATVIVTLAIGIGANTAIFSVVNAVLLRPLPYPASHRLVSVSQLHLRSGTPEWATWPDYVDWRDRATRLQGLGSAWPVAINLTGVDEPERLPGAAVTASLFSVLQVAPVIGRSFSDKTDEDPRSVILGHAMWQRRFASDPRVIGRALELNGRRHTVVGVMPERFSFPPGVELWIPFVPEPGMTRGYHLLTVVGRLGPDATIEQARTELQTLAAQAATNNPDTNKDWGVQVTSLLDGQVGSARPALLILAATVGCVLLIGCINVAALLMARAAARRDEINLRAALGASRSRIARQLLTESLVLALCGGALGLAAGRWAIDPLMALTVLPRAPEVSLDGWVLLFALGVSIATGIGFGLAPVIALVHQPDILTPTPRVTLPLRRFRPALVAVEVGLTMVLLAGAGLLTRSFVRLQQVETGFNGDRILTMRFFLPRASYPADRAASHYQEMMRRLAALPDVDGVAAISHFPFAGLSANMVFDAPGRPTAAPGEQLTAEFRAASPGYFRTMGIAVLNGRDFTEFDRPQSQLVAIVNRAAADRYFPGQNPLDQSVRLLGPKPRRIVGVVQNIRHRELASSPEPEIYVPHAQYPLGAMFVGIRARTGDPGRIAAAARASIRSLDRDLPIASVKTFRELLDASLSRRRFTLTLLALFAVTALGLSAVGICGVLSYTVAQQTREIGIRMALGAARRDVLRLAVRQGMVPVMAGLTGGVVASFAATRALTDMLFEIRPHDAITLATVAGLLLTVSLVATLIPARRAARVDPLSALRHD